MFLKRLFSGEEEKLKKELTKKDTEISGLRFSVTAWQKIHEEDLQAIKDSQKEVAGLRFILDRKDAEIEDLKEQIRGAAG